MRTITVFNHLTLDGVMQAPGRPDEDTRGGFKHGGWATSRNDDVMNEVIGSSMTDIGGLLLGRRTYEDFADFWPKQPDPNPFSKILTEMQKYVASTTLKEPLPWDNSTLLGGDAAKAVAALKKQPGKGLLILGSGVLVQALMERDLVDEFVLLIHPVVMGSGRHLFTDDGPSTDLQLVDTKTTTTGVMISTYRRADPKTSKSG
jgi:dihydrofolate reductase